MGGGQRSGHRATPPLGRAPPGGAFRSTTITSALSPLVPHQLLSDDRWEWFMVDGSWLMEEEWEFPFFPKP